MLRRGFVFRVLAGGAALFGLRLALPNPVIQQPGYYTTYVRFIEKSGGTAQGIFHDTGAVQPLPESITSLPIVDMVVVRGTRTVDEMRRLIGLPLG